jgi:tyrosyl-tRNA synthetase
MTYSTPVITDSARIDEALTRSVAQTLPSKDALHAALKSGKRLTLYVGIDPTADYVHLGHSTNFLLLERFHKLGHRIIVVIGDFTAMIGDPSDQTSVRDELSKEQVLDNMKDFKRQIGKILDIESTENPIEFKFNSDWLSKLTFENAVELASHFTFQQMIVRESFQKRLAEKKPLYVHELFYPLMQGYDSEVLDIDIEVGGTDQTFNMLTGKTLLERTSGKSKLVITTTLLENPETGEKLMNNSQGTGISLGLPPKDMYFKIMQLPDASIEQCFIDCTRLPMTEIATIQARLTNGENPRNIKLLLAKEIVSMYHSAEEAVDAENAWVHEVSEKKLSQDIVTVTLDEHESLIDFMVRLNTTPSKSAARRLILQGAVKIDNEKVAADSENIELGDNQLIQVGKKHSFKTRI